MEKSSKVYIRAVFDKGDLEHLHVLFVMTLKKIGLLKDALIALPRINDNNILTEYLIIDESRLKDFLNIMQESLPKMQFEVSNLPYDNKDEEVNTLITSIGQKGGNE